MTTAFIERCQAALAKRAAAKAAGDEDGQRAAEQELADIIRTVSALERKTR